MVRKDFEVMSLHSSYFPNNESLTKLRNLTKVKKNDISNGEFGNKLEIEFLLIQANQIE